MTRGISRAKFFRPALPDDFIPRHRLWDALDAGLARRLIMVAAPSGFGKSCLVASWMARLERADAQGEFRAAWLSLNTSDDDLRAFWSHVVAAIETAFPDSCPASRELLAANELAPSHRLADVLASECQDLPGRLVIAIDDIHLVAGAAILAALSRWIDNTDPTVTVVLISQSDPHIPIARWRARQQLCEIRAHDLQFTADETAAFLRASLNRVITPEFCHALHAHTEGWIVGLRLAAISLHDRADLMAAAHELAEHSNRFIGDYLADEVLSAQPHDVRNFMIRTSVLPRLSADLCAAVLEQPDSRDCQCILEYLDRRNVFLIALDQYGGWYRYHHQFQTMLQLRRRRDATQPSSAADLRRAAQWFAANDYIDDALAICTALGDFDFAELLVSRAMPGLQLNEHWHELARLLERFPSDEVARRPGLLIARAWAQRMTFRESDVTALAETAEALIDTHPERWPADQAQAWRGAADVLRAMADTGMAPERMVALAERALQRLPDDHVWERAIATGRVAIGLLGMRRVDQALALLDRSTDAVPRDSDLARLRMYYAIAVIHIYAGTCADTAQWCERALDLAIAKNVWWVVPILHAAASEAHYEMNHLDLARQHNERALESEPVFNSLAALPSVLRGLKLDLHAGNLISWQPTFDRFRAAAAGLNLTHLRDLLDGLEAFYHLLRDGEAGRAQQWALSATPDPRRIAATDNTHVKISLMTEIFLRAPSDEGLTRVRDILSQAIDMCVTMNIVSRQIALLIMLARVSAALGRRAEALDALEQAVQLGAPRGSVRPFIESSDVVRLLRSLARAGRREREVIALLQVAHPEATTVATTMRRMQNPALVEPLTDRESDILECLEQHLTNKEIAAKLGISPLTVRNHTGHIYAKLGVSSRRQAVTRAGELGLFLSVAA